MKKSYFLMAAAAAMFAACSETEVLNVAQESAPKAIAFETYAGSATRVDPTAENSGESFVDALEAHHTNFFVWGYKNTATAKVFNGVEVSRVGNAWNYTIGGITNGVYWDKSASKYEFYAAAPATASFWTLNAKTDDQADDYFTTIPFTVAAHNATDALDANPTKSFKDVANATDLMIANKEPNTAITGSVQLDFMHILSRLNITVKETVPGTSVVKLVSLTVKGLGATASFDESKVADPSVGTYGRWGSEVASTWTAGVTTNSVTYTALENQTISDEYQYVLEALVMPQAADHEVVLPNAASGNKPYIAIKYTIGDGDGGVEDEVFTATYNLAAAFGVTSGNTLAFNEGWQNTLNINIGAADVILFSGQVAEWKDNSKKHNVGGNI